MTIVFLLGVAASAAVGAAITAIGTARIEAAHPASGRLIEVTGGRLHVLELGAASVLDRWPVVLVHGASGNLEDMHLTLGSRLAANRRVTLVDRPGHGWSDRPGGAADASPARQAALIAQALDRIGLKVEHNSDGTIHIYQPPGDGNALGRIRFNFPNKFLVYQHDTPDKNLFGKDKRAFSHGCMRVQDPVKYAEVLLSIALPKEGYTQERLHRMFGSSEQNINLPQHIPVHITYQTAYVDDAGKLVMLDDVYGRDARMLAILKGDERRVAEIPVERRETTMTKPIRDPSPVGFGRQNTAGGFNLFGLFR